MRAATYHGPGDIRVEDVSKPELDSSRGAIIRVTHTAVCGSDLWFYRGESDREEPSRVGHEPMGIVEEVGDDVVSVDVGDRVFAPFSSAVAAVSSAGRASIPPVSTKTAGAATTAVPKASTSAVPRPTGRSFASPTATPTTRTPSARSSR